MKTKKHIANTTDQTTAPGRSTTTAVRLYLQEQRNHWTNPRALVFAALLEGPASLADLTDKLHRAVDRASVYRTVGLFEELGIVHRIWSGWKSVIELTDRFSAHHHHFICENCGRLIDFDDKRLETAIAASAAQLGLSANHHHLELFGLCPNCRAKS